MTSRRHKTFRAAVAAYIRAGRHLDEKGRAKTLTQIGSDIGTTWRTVKNWLIRDHYELWSTHWPTAEALHEEWAKKRGPAPSADDQRQRFLDSLPDPEAIGRERENYYPS